MERESERAAWGAISEAEAQRIADVAVQMLADSEPSGDTIDAQDRLKGTPQEHLFCVDADRLTSVIAMAISNATYDAPHHGFVPVTEAPKCGHCGKPATCYGSYENMPSGFACDDCCGHACEDGRCVEVRKSTPPTQRQGEARALERLNAELLYGPSRRPVHPADAPRGILGGDR